MSQTIKLSAFLVANQLDIKGVKSFLDIKPLADSSAELFYGFSGGKYQYYFNYGVVVLAGYNEDEMKWAVKAISAFQKNPLTPWLRDDHELTVAEGSSIAFEFDEVIVDQPVLRRDLGRRVPRNPVQKLPGVDGRDPREDYKQLLKVSVPICICK